MNLLPFFLLLLPVLCLAEPVEKVNDEKAHADIAKISEAFGHLIGKNMETLGVDFDVERVAQGMRDSAQGKKSPMSEEECVQALTSVQEALFKKQAQENLKNATAFLEKNAKEKNVVVLNEGKLQYKIEKTGAGDKIEEHHTPLIRYVGKYLDGSVFGASKEEEALSLDETIAGIQQGLLGMKEGEKRTLFIHPDLAYGTTGLLPPNSLLTFEVEVVKANTVSQTESPSVSTTPDQQLFQELASPSDKREAIR
ncbi:MAG: FKBP-type peptidyl-prolyl cis-trans isomerase [Chlamydiales bacterium]|nr:FKBP-type peptidyl-prolyl cis-trans isomerase [Chlamydiales bacterium]